MSSGTSAVQVNFRYGPDGERLVKSAPTALVAGCPGTPGATETLTLGSDIERVTKPVCASGMWSASSIWTKHVHPDAKRVGTGATAKALFLHRDHLNTVRLVTAAAGAVEERSAYRPYGERTQSRSGAATTDEAKGFIGERDDPETGLVYLHARYYDPAIGRFVSPDTWDPLTPGVGTNRYAYSDNDPINKSDPNGHFVPAIVGIGLAVYAGVEAALSAYETYDAVQTIADPQASLTDKGIAIGGVMAGAALPGAGYGTAAKTAKSALTKTTKEMAQDLATDIGRNRVTATSPGRITNTDVAGGRHFDKKLAGWVDTPHVETRIGRPTPHGKLNYKERSFRPATKQDIRTAREVARRKGMMDPTEAATRSKKSDQSDKSSRNTSDQSGANDGGGGSAGTNNSSADAP